MILGFTSKAAQVWGDPSLIHTLWTPLCWPAHLCSYNRMHSKGTFGPKAEICWNHHSKPAKMKGKAGDWGCVPENHMLSMSNICLHEDNSQGCLLYRYMDRVLHWECLSDSFWRDQLTKRCPACCDEPSFYSFGFWKFIKCPMFANEQWTKAPWDLFGSPILMLIIPRTFLIMVSLLYWLSLPAKIDRHTCMRHHRALPGARPSFSCLGRSKDAKTSGTRNYSTPRIDINRIKY